MEDTVSLVEDTVSLVEDTVSLVEDTVLEPASVGLNHCSVPRLPFFGLKTGPAAPQTVEPLWPASQKTSLSLMKAGGIQNFRLLAISERGGARILLQIRIFVDEFFLRKKCVLGVSRAALRSTKASKCA